MDEDGSNPWYINSPKLTILLVLKQNKQAVSLKEVLKNSRDSHDLKLRIITSTILQSTSKKS